MKPIEVLLITKSEELKKNVSLVLIDHFREQLTLQRVDTLQDAIEAVEQKKFAPELVLVEQKNSSLTVLKLFLAMVPAAASVIVYTEENLASDLKPLEDLARLIFAPTLQLELPLVLKKFESTGRISLVTPPPEEYVAIPAERILSLTPLPSNIFLSLPSGKYVKIFRKGDQVEIKDIGKYTDQTFYLARVDCERIFQDQLNQIEAISNSEPIDVVQAKRVADMSQELVRTLVADSGFTEEAQKVAKASVNMSLKLIGSKPRLSGILQELKKKEGNFVTSHSFLLGQLSCAMAHTVGWNSSSTYFKLSMAAFLHDISLNINTLEYETTYEEAVESGNYKPEELKILRFHPTKAAEYTRQFSEIPADVEQIVAQHHERPDGTGYPRGLAAKYISPLSAIFILAHDLIIFMMKHPDSKVEKFYEIIEKDFNVNPFRKIITALRTDTKIV